MATKSLARVATFELEQAFFKARLAAAIGALLFGFLEALIPRLQTYGFELSPYLVKITPYAITIIILIGLTIYKGGRTGAPSNIGIPFFRESR